MKKGGRVAAIDGNDRDRTIDRSIFPDRGDRIDHCSYRDRDRKGHMIEIFLDQDEFCVT